MYVCMYVCMYVAGLRIGGEKKTFDDHLLVIGDAAGMCMCLTIIVVAVNITKQLGVYGEPSCWVCQLP